MVKNMLMRDMLHAQFSNYAVNSLLALRSEHVSPVSFAFAIAHAGHGSVKMIVQSSSCSNRRSHEA
jgi:hypothetical protein